MEFFKKFTVRGVRLKKKLLYIHEYGGRTGMYQRFSNILFIKNIKNNFFPIHTLRFGTYIMYYNNTVVVARKTVVYRYVFRSVR